MCFLFLISDNKIPTFTCVEFRKKLTSSKERLTTTCIKKVLSNPSKTVILYYLALNAFFVGFFSGINFISVKIIILSDFFCNLEQVLSLI